MSGGRTDGGLEYWLWLALTQLAPGRNLKLLRHWRSPEAIYTLPTRELSALPQDMRVRLEDRDLSRARAVLAECTKNGWRIMTLIDRDYPKCLRKIPDPPTVLYIRGELPDLNAAPGIGVVGTRRCTDSGLKMAEQMGYEIAKCGGVVVTGMALGIDGASASGALSAGGRVVGVLGCGLDIIYPKKNEKLLDAVAGSGALITEYPPGTEPTKRTFPIRNRIISGISQATLVVEAPVGSGALITAAKAIKQGRDVFVVPAGADSDTGRGSNELLRQGAGAALCGWDVVGRYSDRFPAAVRRPTEEELGALVSGAGSIPVAGTRPQAQKRPALREKPPVTTKKVIDNGDLPGYIDILVDPDEVSPQELAVLRAMEGRMHVDDIITRSGLPAKDVLAALTMLEISGAVKGEPGKYFTPHFVLYSKRSGPGR